MTLNNEVAMKACPFCGERQTIATTNTLAIPKPHKIICGKCAAFGPGCETPELAITAWNTRTASLPSDAIEREAILYDIAVMMGEFVDNWPMPKRVGTALALIARTMRASLDLKTALGRITEEWPPDTSAGRIAADALAALTTQSKGQDDGE